MHLVFCFEGFSFVKCILWTKQVCREHDINVPVYERPRGDAMCCIEPKHNEIYAEQHDELGDGVGVPY